jgi:hypothetical protein
LGVFICHSSQILETTNGEPAVKALAEEKHYFASRFLSDGETPVCADGYLDRSTRRKRRFHNSVVGRTTNNEQTIWRFYLCHEDGSDIDCIST